MRTKLIRASLTLALSTVLFAACKRDVRELVLDVKPQEPSAFLALSLSTNDVVLRASESDPLKRVEALRLVFYTTGSAPEVAHTREISIAEESSLSSIEVQLPPNDYTLIAIANPTEELKRLTAQGAPLTHMTSPSALRSSALRSPAAGNTVTTVAMLNAQGLIEVPRSKFATESSSATPISLTIEPALARVLVYGEPTLSNATRGNAEAHYFIAGSHAETYLLRKPAALFGGTLEAPGDASAPANRYAQSPLWEAWQSSAPTSTDGINIYPEAILLNASNARAIKASESEARAQVSSPNTYTKEATAPPSAFLEGTTPCVIIAYPVIPSGLTLSGQEGWLSYRGALYTESNVKAMLRTGSVQPQELAQVIAQEGITQASFDKPFDKGGLRFYRRGLSYYTVYIKHFAGASDAQPYGRYGVVRGNEYRLNLRHIRTIGSPTPPVLQGRLAPVLEQQQSALGIALVPPTSRQQDVAI